MSATGFERSRYLLWALVTGIATLGTPVWAAEPAQPLEFDHPKLHVRLIPRTPDQIAAFYIGRGFPTEMIDVLRKQCFITVGIGNRSHEIIWLDLDNWHFRHEDRPLRRYDRAYWKERWTRMNAPLPAQSTFRWTLLPERLDFRPDEREGGNIILERTDESFSLEGEFATGADRRGEPIRMRFDNLRCAEDPQP